LSYKEISSESKTFTVKHTVNRAGIPGNNFHDLSTSIEDDRRLGTGHLSRCIDIYRPQRRLRTTSPSPAAGRNGLQKMPASNAITPCLTATIHQLFYRHDTALKASVFRKTPKMAAIKCLKWLPHKNFSINFLPSAPFLQQMQR
jgi:hypothetical protein